MKCSWPVSLLLLVFAGCISVKPAHIRRDPELAAPLASSVTKYVSPDSTQLFKASVDITKHHLTGLLVIKRMDPPQTRTQPARGDCSGTYRIVFMNEVGMTFFDLEMKTDSFKVISCFESLNNKALINIFETNFRMLTWNSPLKNEKGFKQNKTGNLVRSGDAGKYHIWQTYSPSGDTLYSTGAKSTIADPVIISFKNYVDGFPLKIILENPFIGMKLTLRKLGQ